MRRTVWIVYRKELGDFLRDPYVAIGMVIVPTLFLALVLIQGHLARNQTLAELQASSRTLVFFIPLLLILAAIVGGMGAAVNTTAGERERHTLEALLLTPSTRGQVVTGKILAVGTLTVITVAVSLLVVSVTLVVEPIRDAVGTNISLANPSTSLAVMAWTGLLLALSLAATMVALGALAHNLQQSWGYMVPLFLLAVGGATLVAIAADWHPPLAVYAVPLLGALLLTRDTLLHSMTQASVAVTSASLIALTLACWVAALRLFSRETLVM